MKRAESERSACVRKIERAFVRLRLALSVRFCVCAFCLCAFSIGRWCEIFLARHSLQQRMCNQCVFIIVVQSTADDNITATETTVNQTNNAAITFGKL